MKTVCSISNHFIASTFLALLCLGCGDTQNVADWQPGDKDQIRQLVAELSDARTNPDKLNAIFVEDAVPEAAWKRAAAKFIFVVGDVSFESDTASVKIDFENSFGEVIGEQEWTCTKVDDEWRIAAAPLE